jgi:predicted lactoylglutathione lyase
MEPKFIWTNLASNDLERTTEIYTTLGFEQNEKWMKEPFFFFGKNKFVIDFFTEQ